MFGFGYFRNSAPAAIPSVWTPAEASPPVWFKHGVGEYLDEEGTEPATEVDDTVARWNHASGSGIYATQGDFPKMPLLTAGGVLSDGLDDTLILSEEAVISEYYALFKSPVTPWGNYGSLLDTTTTARMAMFDAETTGYYVSGPPREVRRNGAELVSPFLLAPITEFMVVRVRVGNPLVSRVLQLFAMQNTYFQSLELTELVGFTTDQDDVTRDLLETYLAGAGGITL